MFPFFNVARPGQLCSTHFKYFTSLFVLYLTYSRALCSYLNPVLHGNGLTFAITCTVQQYFGLSAVSSMYVSVQARVYCTSNFTCAFFTRAFHTCVVYMPIPLPAQSIPPKMTITRGFITRALSHPENSTVFNETLLVIPETEYKNKNSVIAKIAAQSCIIRIFAVECGISLPVFNALICSNITTNHSLPCIL